MVLCLDQGTDLHMAQLMPLPITVSCSSESRLVLPSWFYLSGAGSLGWSRTESKRAIKQLCMRVCVHACVHACMHACHSNSNSFFKSFVITQVFCDC